jgi:hypothetical protein
MRTIRNNIRRKITKENNERKLTFVAGLVDQCGPVSLVGIATGYALDGPGIGC